MPGKTLATLPMYLDLHLPLALSFRQPACRPNAGGDNGFEEPQSPRWQQEFLLDIPVPGRVKPLSSFLASPQHGGTP